MTPRHDFASDNTAGAAPEALAALVDANAGHAAAYGEDHFSDRAADLIRELLDTDAEVRFVASGTAANALSLAALCRPFEAVLTHQYAHIVTSETGAPGYFGHGLGLIGLPGEHGRIDLAALTAAMAEPDSSHHPGPAALSITNATEFGAVYDDAALAALTAQAKTGAHPLKVHLDGARLANAAAAGLDLKALKSTGLDTLIVGGAKAGMTPTEAIVLFDKSLVRRFDARLKQAGQMPSKSRYYAAPWIGMLETGAYVRHAAHANAMARKLAAAAPFEAAHPVESNSVFLRMDLGQVQRLWAAGWIVHPIPDGTARFMCSWATTEAAVEEMVEALRGVD